VVLVSQAGPKPHLARLVPGDFDFLSKVLTTSFSPKGASGRNGTAEPAAPLEPRHTRSTTAMMEDQIREALIAELERQQNANPDRLTVKIDNRSAYI
jgi:hypothetical protein